MEDLQVTGTESELSDNEMKTVSGGNGSDYGNGGCGCVFAGGGGGTDEGSGKTYGCACVGYGQGGIGNIFSFNCTCFTGGIGVDREI